MINVYSYFNGIDLHVKGRISKEDAERQSRTAKEIMKRFTVQPGVILADEVGMGKTFVALAVACSVAIADKRKRPVVVMVPSSLKEKWPRDFELFLEKCIPPDIAGKIKHAKAERAVEFLKLLDDPIERRKSIIFLTHGAMSRGLNDKWVKLALIYRALYHRKNIDNLRKSVYKFVGELLKLEWVAKSNSNIWQELLTTDPARWLDVLLKNGIDPENDNNPETDDDPVPQAVLDILGEINTDTIFEAFQKIPRNITENYWKKLRAARREIDKEMRIIWQNCINKLKFTLPLLIMDEAHHLKNAGTRLASLFQYAEAGADADEVSRGSFSGKFERMLFLTATPFQLGHYELCSVLDRFASIKWNTTQSPLCEKEDFLEELKGLSKKLDVAQESVLRLDKAWSRLKKEDIAESGFNYEGADAQVLEKWWEDVQKSETVPPAVLNVVKRYEQTLINMKRAEEALKPWVIRHIKPKYLSDKITRRRCRFSGGTINKTDLATEKNIELPGIQIEGRALLPFLLAARVTACTPESRPVFAEGLSSSYEAFTDTRKKRENNEGKCVDDDDEDSEITGVDDISSWYLSRLQISIPRDDTKSFKLHPKIEATVGKVLDLWRNGEKVLIFCHYIATGRALRRHISTAINNEIIKIGSKKLGCSPEDVMPELERIGKRFYDEDAKIRKACDREIYSILQSYPEMSEKHDEIVELVRRNIRTPSFLVRFFPLNNFSSEDVIKEAFKKKDGSGKTLKQILSNSFEFLGKKCGKLERDRYIDAINRIQTGSHYGSEAIKTYSDDELQGDNIDKLIPNVRLVNGSTRSDTRQRLMLTFNTPFFPDILVASSVMAEGVDLHLSCRYVIHHDLCWNPSTLEQRTGRVDRIGAKAEKCMCPINVFIPYIAETQDEKMYRVVMDRERWFKVVMGEKYKMDAKTTDKEAERIPLPATIADELAFKLDIMEENV